MSIQVTDELLAAAKALPKDKKEAASNLLTNMATKIEGIGDQAIEWRPSFLRLIQPTANNIPDGAGIGSLVVGERVLTDSKNKELSIIPLMTWDSREFWNEDPNVSQTVCSSPDAKFGNRFGKCWGCEHAVFVDGQGSDCNKSKSFLAVLSDLSEVVILKFAKTQYKTGMEFFNMLKRAGVMPFKRTYNLTTGKGSKGAYYNMSVQPSTDKPSAAEDAFLAELFSIVSSDRKESLERFYEYLNNKQSQQQNTGIGHENGGQAALEDKSADDTIEGEVLQEDADTSDGASKKYAL